MDSRIVSASLLLMLAATQAKAADFNTRVSLLQRPASTYYVPARFEGAPPTELMVDTGAAYVTITEQTLRSLQAQNKAVFKRDLVAVMADGSEQRAGIYQVAALTVGELCTLQGVEVAVVPGSRRQLLGLSALRKLAPFAVSVEPPGLMLSGCASATQSTPALAQNP